MSKYQPLADRLSGHPQDEWRTSFSELEGLLGFPLPKTARSSAAWWANDSDRPHCAWTTAGWLVCERDRPGEIVIFRRNAATADIEAAGGLVDEAPAATSAAPSRVRQMAPFVAAGVAGVAVLGGLTALFMRNAGRLRSTSRA